MPWWNYWNKPPERNIYLTVTDNLPTSCFPKFPKQTRFVSSMHEVTMSKTLAEFPVLKNRMHRGYDVCYWIRRVCTKAHHSMFCRTLLRLRVLHSTVDGIFGWRLFVSAYSLVQYSWSLHFSVSLESYFSKLKRLSENLLNAHCLSWISLALISYDYAIVLNSLLPKFKASGAVHGCSGPFKNFI